MDPVIQEKVNGWLADSYDEQTRNLIKKLQQESPEELTESFYRNLEFGKFVFFEAKQFGGADVLLPARGEELNLIFTEW